MTPATVPPALPLEQRNVNPDPRRSCPGPSVHPSAGPGDPVPGLPRAGLPPHLRPAAVRLHVASGAVGRLPVPQGRVGPDRHPARRADQHRRADRRAARRAAVAAGRPLGPLQGHHPDGRPVERGHPGLRGRGQLRADDARPVLHRARRSRLRKRRPRGRADGVLADQACVPDRRVHGRRLVRLGARGLPRRHPGRPLRLALVLRRDGDRRPGAGGALRPAGQRPQARPQPAPRQRRRRVRASPPSARSCAPWSPPRR